MNPNRRDILKAGLAGFVAATFPGCMKPEEKTPAQAGQSTVLPPTGCTEYVDIPLSLNQKLGDERETITRTDLPSVLAQSDVNGTKVNQWLRFGDPQLSSTEDKKTRTVLYGQNEKDEWGNFLFVKDGDPIFCYELEFETGFESKVDANGNLTDLVGKQLNILGDSYKVIRAVTDNLGLDMTLVTGDFKTQDASQTITHTVNGKNYSVVVQTASQNTQKAQYKVNGEVTGVLAPGDFYTLTDGTVISHTGVKKVANVVDVDYALDACVLEWEDTALTDNKPHKNTAAKHNGNTIEDATINMYGQWLTNKTSTLEIQNLQFQLLSDAVLGDLYVGRGETVREHLDEPEGLVSRKLTIGYAGKTADNRHIVRLCKQ